VEAFLLGGDYSLLTNKHGLGMDNIVGFQIITPSATTQLQVLSSETTVCDINPGKNSELSKALKVWPSYHCNMALLIINFMTLREEGITSGLAHFFLCRLTWVEKRVSVCVALVDFHWLIVNLVWTSFFSNNSMKIWVATLRPRRSNQVHPEWSTARGSSSHSISTWLTPN
jgi:hypothetical protein